MKLIMKSTEEKGGSGGSGCSNNNSKIRIAVIGQHDVGKSALTVRYLTRRYIGEYKSNTDLLYRQTLTASYGSYLDIEIVDVATTGEGRKSDYEATVTTTTTTNATAATFPGEEYQKADAFIVVYSITDRKSFAFAQTILSALCSSTSSSTTSPPSPAQQNQNSTNQNNTSASSLSKTSPSSSSPIVLLANKSDLEHLRVVEKVEGLSLALHHSCQFHEISVAENSPELYQSFHNIISNYANQLTPPNTSTKRKFSVSKMLGNLRIGRTSPSQTQIMSQASIVHTSTLSESSFSSSTSSLEPTSPGSSVGGDSTGSESGCSACSASTCSGTCSKSESSQATNTTPSANVQQQQQQQQSSNLSNSICHIKSKIAEFHSIRMRHNSPPICSL